jgi:hypothetical protein
MVAKTGSARTMESERSELAELNKMKGVEILNGLKIETLTSVPRGIIKVCWLVDHRN